MEKLRSCFYQHDVEEVLKIRLSDSIQEDHIAWYYEKSGMFTVKSAYRLAVQTDPDMQKQVGSSRQADGKRELFNNIWKAPVPQKVKVFAWRLSMDGVATQLNRKRRTLVKFGTCQICGVEDEKLPCDVLRPMPSVRN